MENEIQTNETNEQDTGSLLNLETTEATEATETTETTQEGQQKLFAGKYKTPEALEEGYKNAQGALTKANQQLKSFEIPEEYTFGDKSFEDGEKDVWADLGQKAKLTQEQLDTVMDVYNGQGQVSNDRISQELGADKNEIVASLQKYAKNLNDADRATLEGMLTSANGYRLLAKMTAGGATSVPKQNNYATKPALTADELYDKYDGIGNMTPEQFQEYSKAVVNEKSTNG